MTTRPGSSAAEQLLLRPNLFGRLAAHFIDDLGAGFGRSQTLGGRWESHLIIAQSARPAGRVDFRNHLSALARGANMLRREGDHVAVALVPCRAALAARGAEIMPATIMRAENVLFIVKTPNSLRSRLAIKSS